MHYDRASLALLRIWHPGELHDFAQVINIGRMIAVEDMPFSSVICTCMLVQANAATFTQHVKACARATGNKAKPHVVFSHAGGMLLACVTLAGVLKWREEAGTPLEQLRVTAFDHAYNASTEGPETAARRLMQHFNVQIHWTFCSTEEQMCRMSRTHPFDVLLQQDIDIRTRSGGCTDNSTALATVRCRCTKIITQRTRVLVWDAVGLDGHLCTR
jgi:roadblock/LC7 domain-containing protein